MMNEDPSIEAAIIDDFDQWDGVITQQISETEASKWEKFGDVGLFKNIDLPPIKKASEVTIGVKFPLRSIKKLTLKHGASVSLIY